MQIILMSGIPGSGKSTYIANHFPGALVCSADHHHIKDGKYLFDPKEQGNAHAACLRKFIETITGSDHPPYLVVDNTHTTALELAPYVSIATAYGFKARIVTLYCEAGLGASKNIHGVPHDVCVRMENNLINRKIPPYWNVSCEDLMGG